MEACKTWIKISVLFYCLLGLRNALHKNDDSGCGGSVRWRWLHPHHLNPAQQPAGQVDVAAGISRHQYMWVERLENTCSVRSRIHRPVIQALCHDRLFLGIVGHYWLNKSFLRSWALFCPWLGRCWQGKRLGLEGEGERGRMCSRKAVISWPL